jgi:hypothetical protein
MRVHSSISTARIAFGLGMLLGVPAATRAQTFVGLAGGLNYQGSAPAGEHYTRGFAVQASVGRQLLPRLALRLDAFASRFDDTRPTVTYNYPCLPSGCGPNTPTPGFVEPVGMAGFTANWLVNVNPQGSLYVITGGGAYYLYQHPSAEGSVRLGMSVGAGVSVPVGSRSHAFVEARYHGLVGAPSLPTWLLPLTFGIRF